MVQRLCWGGAVSQSLHGPEGVDPPFAVYGIDSCLDRGSSAEEARRVVQFVWAHVTPNLPTIKAATPDTAGADMLVPDAKQQPCAWSLPLQLLTTMFEHEAWLSDAVGGGQGRSGVDRRRCNRRRRRLGGCSCVSPPGPEKSTIERGVPCKEIEVEAADRARDRTGPGTVM